MFENQAQAFGGTTRLLALIELIYSAADAALWPAILDLMGEAINGEQMLLAALLDEGGESMALRSVCTAPEVAKDYLDQYLSANILSEPRDQMFPTGPVRYSSGIAIGRFQTTNL
jgi:hypothetical protein